MAYLDSQKGTIVKDKLLKSTVSELSNNPVGTYYLADNPQYYEPQRTNTFSFYVAGLDQLLKDHNITINTDTSVEKVLELSVKTSSVPHFGIDPITINRGNSQMKFAGKPTFDAGSITVNDYIGAQTKDILMAWQSLAYNVETEKVGLASDYKLDAFLLEYAPDYTLVRTWVLRGCWVTKISEDNYDHENTSAKTLTVDISYDKAYIDQN